MCHGMGGRRLELGEIKPASNKSRIAEIDPTGGSLAAGWLHPIGIRAEIFWAKLDTMPLRVSTRPVRIPLQGVYLVTGGAIYSEA
jgi:hypothetical protein